MTVIAADSNEPAPASLVDRARAGDADAFLALVRRHEPELRGLVARMLGEPDRVPDVLQETFLRAFRALPKFRGDASLGTWLYRIAYNICLDELRRPRLRLVPLEDAELAAAPADTAATVGRSAALRAALAALPPDERAAVLLVDGEGFDYTSAGEVLGVPAGTIASRLSRARGALRKALAEPPEGVHRP